MKEDFIITVTYDNNIYTACCHGITASNMKNAFQAASTLACKMFDTKTISSLCIKRLQDNEKKQQRYAVQRLARRK